MEHADLRRPQLGVRSYVLASNSDDTHRSVIRRRLFAITVRQRLCFAVQEGSDERARFMQQRTGEGALKNMVNNKFRFYHPKTGTVYDACGMSSLRSPSRFKTRGTKQGMQGIMSRK